MIAETHPLGRFLVCNVEGTSTIYTLTYPHRGSADGASGVDRQCISCQILSKSEVRSLVGYTWLRLWGPPLAVVPRLTDWRVKMTTKCRHSL
jgi:hypothetical protein